MKRLTALGVVMAALLVGLRLWWGREAQRRVDAYVEAARARGEPMLAEDFAPPQVPPGQDANALFQRAWGGVTLTQQQHDFTYDFPGVLPLNAQEVTLLEGMLQANAAPLADARAARARARRDAGTVLRGPLPLVMLPQLKTSRQLGRVIEGAALYSHHAGDHAEALEAVRDLLASADVLQRDAPFWISLVIATWVDEMAVNVVVQVAPDLPVEPTAPASTAPAPASPPGRPASRAQVRAVITELLDEAAPREALVRATRGERAGVLELVPMLEQQRPAAMTLVMRPAWKLDALRTLRRFDVLARAAVQPTYPQAVALLPPPPHRTEAGPSRLESLTRPIRDLPSTSPEKVLLPHHRRVADRRLAAVALAARLFRADHGGAWPRGIEDLVPAYLPAVPGDPFDARGGPMRYRLSGGAAAPDGPVAYSLGEDGADDGGSLDLPPGHRRRETVEHRWQTRDAALPLAQNPRARPPEEPPSE
jgi:hypothetical protein